MYDILIYKLFISFLISLFTYLYVFPKFKIDTLISLLFTIGLSFYIKFDVYIFIVMLIQIYSLVGAYHVGIIDAISVTCFNIFLLLSSYFITTFINISDPLITGYLYAFIHLSLIIVMYLFKKKFDKMKNVYDINDLFILLISAYILTYSINNYISSNRDYEHIIFVVSIFVIIIQIIYSLLKKSNILDINKHLSKENKNVIKSYSKSVTDITKLREKNHNIKYLLKSIEKAIDKNNKSIAKKIINQYLNKDEIDFCYSGNYNFDYELNNYVLELNRENKSISLEISINKESFINEDYQTNIMKDFLIYQKNIMIDNNINSYRLSIH